MILFRRVENHQGANNREIMKPTTYRMLGLQTSCLCAFVVILGFVIALASVSAQESKSVSQDAKSEEAPAVAAKTTSAKPEGSFPQMPDISGVWRNCKDPSPAGIVIHRVEDGTGDFRFEERPGRLIPAAPIKWFQSAQHFEQLMFASNQKDPAKRTLQLLADGKTMRVTVSFDEALQKELVKNGSITEAEQKELLNQEWIRTQPPAPTTAGPTEEEEPVDPQKPGRVGLESATPLLKELVELFGPRGARVLDYEEGKLLKLEAPSEVMDDLGKLLELVGQEYRRQAKPGPKVAAENRSTLGLAQPSAAAQASSKTAADSKMPDITGTWRVKLVSPEIKAVPIPEMEIRRVQNGATDFLIDQPWVTTPTRVSVKWSAARQRFEGAWEDDGDQSKITLQPLTDSGSMLVIIAAKKPPTKETVKDGGTKESQWEELVTQEWTRTSLSFSTTFPAKLSGLPGTTIIQPDAIEKVREPTERLEVIHRHTKTPAARQLVEQLQAQESTAAVEAATIRQLQANRQAEQNKQPIAEHQRKLKNLLSTAFDLKLQLEELQVKELQSRLSRLERQIGQRKELREKIITRRATELTEGNVLRSDSTASAPAKVLEPSVGDPRKSSTAAATPKSDQIVIEESIEAKSADKPEDQALSQPLNDVENVPLNAEDIAGLILERLGVKVGNPVAAKGVPSRYRGGLTIVEVSENGPAAKAGFRKGDIFVGLHVWEILSLDNLSYALRHRDTSPSSGQSSFRAYVVRDGETRFANVVLAHSRSSN